MKQRVKKEWNTKEKKIETQRYRGHGERKEDVSRGDAKKTKNTKSRHILPSRSSRLRVRPVLHSVSPFSSVIFVPLCFNLLRFEFARTIASTFDESNPLQ